MIEASQDKIARKKGVLVDLTKCIGCNSCVVACKMYNDNKWIDDRNPHPAPTDGQDAKLADENWTVVRKCRVSSKDGERLSKDLPIQSNGTEVWRYIKEQCLHCKDAACVSSCFASAFRHTEQGPVVYYPNLCVGCRYCMLACPFSIPKFEWNKALPMLTKCTMCSKRVEDGDAPACIVVCPTDVMLYGDYDEVLREAKRRLADPDSRYVQHIYGEREAGGTLWIYISDKPFETLGFKTNVPMQSIPAYTRGFTTKSVYVGAIWATVLACLYFFTGRVAEKKAKDKEPGA